MKIKVIKENCIKCGACVGTAPEIMDYDDDGCAKVTVPEITKELEELAEEAIAVCPVSAIVKE